MAIIVALAICQKPCKSFSTLSSNNKITCFRLRRQNTLIFVSKVNEFNSKSLYPDEKDSDAELIETSDEELLMQTPVSQLVDLCKQFGLATTGRKAALLQRLRAYAKEQSELEHQRRLDRRRRVEEGGENEKERYEILDEDKESEAIDDDEIVIYYHSDQVQVRTANQNKSERKQNAAKISQNFSTEPTPPPTEPDENGERVVTVYSTTDQNDLTGVAAAQPWQAAASDPMLSNLEAATDAPWEQNNPQRGKASSSERESARAIVVDLVKELLVMSGLPAFKNDDFDDISILGAVKRKSPPLSTQGFSGFDPSKVPAEMLAAASKALRADRGQVLEEVLHEFELRAVGHDGTAGDAIEKGGGHYREVAKVRSFLEGYRRTEVRQLARSTVTMLLDKLVTDGIEGLDITLASMTRSSDDTSDVAGELNDSLLDYLNDAIRQQEKKVEQMVETIQRADAFETSSASENTVDDPVDKLWSVESEDGQRVETFNPNDPYSKEVLEKEYEKTRNNQFVARPMVPKTAPEKLLLLLTLLRERIKTEAAFMHDEKSRNLRILSYCMHLSTTTERDKLIMKEFGNSLDVSN